MELDFSATDAQAGFRLDRLEIFNWGTFDGHVWTLEPKGLNALVTGEIGSGKSTLVDAVTTLLVPAQQITFNKAAGAVTRERNLRSYVLGYYKSEESAAGPGAKPVALRDAHSYSVLLASFFNQGFEQRVTIAQVFWHKDPQGQPARVYVVSQDDLRITQDFSNFDREISKLKKRLRARGAHVSDSFPAYGAELCRRLGIKGRQALELFNQTVSMKSVGNLTSFVRSHMLEPSPIHEKVQALTEHFDDLTRAHDAVQKARRQLQMLEPIAADGAAHRGLSEKKLSLAAQRAALPFWVAELRLAALTDHLNEARAQLEAIEAAIEELEHRRVELGIRRDEIKDAIYQNGGDRLERLSADIKRLEEAKRGAKRQAETYTALCKALAMPSGTERTSFVENLRAAEVELKAIDDDGAELQNQILEASVALRECREAHEEVIDELASLRARQSNIPRRLLQLRDEMAGSVGLLPEQLPFAGELIQVHDSERAWEGAIERLVRSFGLSILVSDDDYTGVARWVDGTRIGQRLVYYRVRPPQRQRLRATEASSLVRKLQVKPDARDATWLQSQLTDRFDYVCAEDLVEFRRASHAVTKNGQIKGGRGRHEKDDRHDLNDRRRFVLGWTNEEKIHALDAQRSQLEKQCQDAGAKVAEYQRQHASLLNRRRDLDRLVAIQRFTDIDWVSIVHRIDELTEQRSQLERNSDILRELRAHLKAVESEIKALQEQDDKAKGERGAIGNQIKELNRQQQSAQHKLNHATDEHHGEFEGLNELAAVHAIKNVDLSGLGEAQDKLLKELDRQLDKIEKRTMKLRDKIVGAMKEFSHQWPVETREVDANIEALAEFESMLEAIRSDDLPKFEARFKQLLNENTIREVAGFQAQLDKERRTILDRIETINRSLHAIDYNPGRYIVVVAEPNNEPEIREFRQDLKACTEGGLTGSLGEQYAEAKFLQVKAIVDRFKGRKDHSEADRRWTTKVTDVRQWFVFSASERFRDGDEPFEHYTDSSGKSGGQKEKLAYTVLAASLAYQFGLELGEKRSKSFRFVAIDEAFGRGSDESARFGLELFAKLNLQLLVVTPLQKIHIIEPHVNTVGFVHANDSRSQLRNLSIEEYRQERQSRAGGHQVDVVKP